MANQTAAAMNKFQNGIGALTARRPEEALIHLSAAQHLGYSASECAAHRWHCWMLLGDFESAWRESDAIAQCGGPDRHRLWDGLPFDGKRLIVRGLHGLGDTIQFARYLEPLRDRAASVVLETHGELTNLLRHLPGLERVVTWADGSSAQENSWDQQIEIMELPRAFRTMQETIPSPASYLHLSGTSRQPAGTTPRVGLLWASGDWNPARSLPAESLIPLLRIHGLSFYSFQRGPRRDGIAALTRHTAIHDTAEHSPDIADTAADLLKMDLLITVDTMAAHLAGALGVPVWVLLPWDADWRWMLDREDSPWYTSMTLFRQPTPGDWATPVQAITARLAERFRRAA